MHNPKTLHAFPTINHSLPSLPPLLYTWNLVFVAATSTRGSSFLGLLGELPGDLMDSTSAIIVVGGDGVGWKRAGDSRELNLPVRWGAREGVCG